MEPTKRPLDLAMLSSSPAFATPHHPLPVDRAQRPPPPPAFKPAVTTILPILIPPPALRPLAFRVFTKKYNLTLHSTALQALAAFIGKHCGSGWREEGTGEKVLEEVAKIWKAENAPVIVEDGDRLKSVLKALDGCMSGGRVGPAKNGSSLSRQSSFAFGNDSAVDLSDAAAARPRLERNGSSLGISSLNVDSPDEDDEHDANRDPRSWLKVVSAFDQPRLSYDALKKHFVTISASPSLFPPASHRTAIFKERYNIIHQRLQRNSAFQAPSFATHAAPLQRQGSALTDQQFYKLTSIANLLGRGGTSHLLLGMLVVAPTGTLALHDPTGSIAVDLQHATSMQGGSLAPYFCPGMIVLIDGIYEEEWNGAGSSGLGNTGGVGGTIGGRFLGFQIGGPPVEKRDVSLGLNLSHGDLGGGFGWTDFLGLGSQRSIGSKMTRIENRLIGPGAELSARRRQMVILADVTLDQPSTIAGLRRILEAYSAADTPPLAFLVAGNFSSRAAMTGAGTDSIEYKELFNDLAAVLSEFPSLLRECTWIFVPGDNDPWPSSFSAGASTLVPRDTIPELFTSRIRRAWANAKAEASAPKNGDGDGEAVWTSNPARLSLFGPAHEMVVFRDDMSGRLRRNAVRIGQAVQPPPPSDATTQETPAAEDAVMADASAPTAEAPAAADAAGAPAESFSHQSAKRLILSLLPQSTLSPFSLNVRPVHWDHASSALSLYPLPHTLVLADPDAPAFALTYEGCHVINPGRLVQGSGRSRKLQWVEYDCWTKRGSVKEEWLG